MNIETIIPQGKALLIKRWSTTFENGQTRRLKNLSYSLAPVNHDRLGYNHLVDQPGGYMALVLFNELVRMAAFCPQRGLLVRGTGAVSLEEISADTRMPTADVAQGLELLMGKQVGWLECVACPKQLVVSGSLRAGRKGRPKQPEFVVVDHSLENAPDLHIEWELAMVDMGNGPEVERHLPEPIKRLLYPEPEELTEEASVVCHKSEPNAQTSEDVACHTDGETEYADKFLKKMDLQMTSGNNPKLHFSPPQKKRRNPVAFTPSKKKKRKK